MQLRRSLLVAALAATVALALAGPGAAASAAGAARGPDAAVASGTVRGSAVSGATGAASCIASPPCGWINPLIAIDLENKPPCRSPPTDCMTPPAHGQSRTFEGVIRWYWDMSQDGTYPNEPLEDIVVTFSGTSSNPSWITIKTEPTEFRITTVDLFNPQHWRSNVDPADPTATDPNGVRLLYSYELPLTVTLTRVGDPNPAEVQRINDREGIQSVFLKAKSTASSDRFKEAFGVEEFRFYALAEPGVAQDVEASGAAVVAAMAAVGAAVAVRTRRRT